MPRNLMAVVLALALTACAADTARPVASAPPPEPEPEVVIAEAAPEPVPEPVSEAVIEAAIAAVIPDEPPAPAAPPEPTIDDDPAQVIDLNGAALEALLGVPSFSRRETGAQVWQYAGTACILDVYLYDDGPDTPYRVTYFEIRGDSAERLCLRNLLLARLSS
jgi:hypothetical protein